jgi:hypothetical protein
MWTENLAGYRMNVSGLNSNNINSLSGKNGIVSGEEFELLTRELFSSASKAASASGVNASKISQTRLPKVDMGINFFSENTNAEIIKNASINKTGFDVQLSTKAVSDIQLLRTEAAKTQLIDRKVEGKIVLPSDVSGSLNLKSIFSVNHTSQFLNAGKADKDRKGSNPFDYVPVRVSKKENENKDSLNIFA